MGKPIWRITNKGPRSFKRRDPIVAPRATSSPDATFLYVIRSLHLVKIGHAANLFTRMSNLRVDNPHGSVLVRHWELPREFAKEIDHFVRIDLLEHKHVGDWHEISDEEAIAAVENQISYRRHLYERRRELDERLEAVVRRGP